MRRRLIRWLAISAVGVVALVILGVLALHTNPVQSRILEWSVAELERRFDLDLTADDLHYNLAARRVTMTNVRLAAVGQRDNPFFSAATVTVRLPWVAYRGRLVFDEVDIARGSVTITRDAQGVSNLPPGRGKRDPNAPPRRFDIRGLVVRSLDFLYRDYQRDIEIRTPQIRTDLTYTIGEGATGPFAIEHDVLIRVRERRVMMKPVQGQMAFDGVNVGLDGVALDTTEGVFTLAGEIERAFDRPNLNLTFNGKANIERASRWARPPIHVAGEATLAAHMTGAPSAFVLDSVVTAEDAEVGDERGVRIDAEARLTLNGIAVSRSTIRPATGGEILATVDVPFGAHSPWWIKANYSNVDAATAFRLAEVTPLPFGAALSGTARFDRASGRPFRLELHNRSTPRAATGTAPLEGDVKFVIEGDRWSADQRHRMGSTRVEGRIGGMWNRQAATRSTFEGDLAVSAADVAEAARFAALFGLTTPEIVRNSRGPLTADVKMSGIFTEPRFSGTARTSGLEIPSVGRAAFTADFDASASALNAINIDATVGASAVRGEVFANLRTRQLTGQLQLVTPSVADLLSTLPDAMRLQGALSATAVLSGSVDSPEIAAEVGGTDLTMSGQQIESITGKAHLVGEGVNVEGLTLRQPGGGRLRATGRYEWGTRTYDVDLDGEELVWRGTLARLGDAEARVSLKFAGAGPVDRPVGEGVLEFAVFGGVAGELIDRGVANVRLNGEAALITARIPALGAFISANVLPRQPFAYEAVVVMNRIDLAPLVRLSGLGAGHVSGFVSLSANAKGTFKDLAGSNVFINLQDIQAEVSEVPVRLVTPSRLAWDGTGLDIDSLDVTLGNGRLLASGRLGEGGIDTATWEASYKGELGDLLKVGRPFGVPSGLQGSGAVNGVWRSTGGLGRSTASVQLQGGSVVWATLPPVRNLVLDATFNGTTLNVTQFTGQWQDGGIEGTASIPRAVLEARETGGPPLPPDHAGFARLRVSGLGEAALAPWLSTATLAGIDARVSATLDARITRPSLAGITGSLVVDEAVFTLAGVSVQQVQASVFSIDGGLIAMKDVSFNAGGSPLTFSGTIQLTPTEKQRLDLDVRGTADLQILSAFAPMIATDGEAKISMGIGGSLRAPVFNGRIDVVNAEVAIREPRVVISELNGTIALDGQRVLFDSLAGSANGGGLTVDGGFLLDGFTPVSGGLTMVVDRAALEYPAGLQSEANAIVTLRPSAAGWSLTGDINVERSVYNDTISLAALIAARQSQAPSAGSDDSWIDQLRLNLFVTTLQDLAIDNNYGRLEAGGALRVGGTVSDPSLAGRITLREGGEVYLAGNTFHLSRGSISFTNPTRIVPEFDIELRTLVSGNDISLVIDGPLDRLRTDVRSSDPNVDSREAMASLFGGFQGEDAITLLSAELLGATGRAIGLDTLRVERGFNLDEFRADPGLIATETDPSTRLTLSKRLRPDVELILSQSLRETGGLSAIVSYKPRRNIEIRGVSRDNLDRSVALRHEITFGGNGAAAGPDGGREVEVAAITITGNPQRPVEELMNLLEMDVGDRFDFHSWQRDIDNLREEFHAAKHYEVRVRSTREISEDGATVALNYSIEPGPVADLVIEGHPLESDLQDDIREAWRRTIFDRFLLEEIRQRINRHLIEEDVIGSKVDAVVAVSTPQRKQIRITVTPGTIVGSRSVRYTGNAAYDADRLDRVIEQTGVGVEGWLDPGRLAEALENFYRAEGYLSVTVKAGQSSVAGQAGVLPVAIEEGPRFLVGSLTFPGLGPNRVPDIAAAVRLDSGVPFVTAEIDAARERVETYYAGLGFNTVQIEVETEPNLENGTVAVSFAILEGLQQVLREVTTQGATRTRDGVIRQSLRLRLGQPVNLTDWSQARKRLYDTNVFRQVDIEPVPIEPTTEESAAGIQPVRALVRVVEYPVWRLRYGLQFNDETAEVPDPDGDARLQNLGILADLQNQNVFGRAVTAGIAARYERNRQAGSLFTSNGSFFGLPIRSSAFLFTSRQRFFATEDISTIDQRVGVTAEQRWRPFRTAEVIWSYRFERSHTFDPEATPENSVIPLDEVIKISRLNVAMFFDRRDDPSDPTRGWFSAANVEQAIEALGSDYGNAKLLLQHSLYRGIGGVVFAGRAQFGTAFGDQALIASERFLLGGATTVRGYAENSLGPRFLTVPAGGDALLNVNGEVRFPVRGWVQGVAFVDAGNVFATRGELSFSDLAVGYGLGLRLASPFAMLRVDFGLPARTLNPERPANQLKSGRWYIGIGHIF